MINATVVAGDRLQSRGGWLTLRSGDKNAPTLEIGEEPRVVGRNPACHLVVNDSKVSSLHVEFVASDRGVRLRDLGSRNGTWIGNARVLEALLTERVSLWIGETELEFEPSSPKKVPLLADSTLGPLYGISPQMRSLSERLRRVAATDLTVLILGETGTGKEVAARAIHEASPRRDSPFVVIDCGSIAAALADATLFGHERGAFTDADRERVSPFVEANGGTVFLDEIGELPLENQPKLLRALADRRIKPVGGSSYVPIDVRVLAATRRDLTRSVNQGSFRTDLYFRLAQLTVTLPPLRERREDIPGLLKQMLAELGAAAAWRRIPPRAIERLVRYDWPGNVRELRNALTVALALAGDSQPVEIAAPLGAAARKGAESAPDQFRLARQQNIEDFERSYFERLLQQCEGNVSEMARRAGLERSHVRRHLKRLGLRSKE